MTSRRISTARGLRQQAGYAEQKVWALLRGGRVDGHKFRRHFPVGPYVADFACVQLRLLIEVDGAVHDLDEVVTRDHWRQEALQDAGWTVLRVSNDDAIGRPERIIEAIRAYARLIES